MYSTVSTVIIKMHQYLCTFMLSKQLYTVKQESYAKRAQTSADPEDPDFGLWTPGSEA